MKRLRAISDRPYNETRQVSRRGGSDTKPGRFVVRTVWEAGPYKDCGSSRVHLKTKKESVKAF